MTLPLVGKQTSSLAYSTSQRVRTGRGKPARAPANRATASCQKLLAELRQTPNPSGVPLTEPRRETAMQHETQRFTIVVLPVYRSRSLVTVDRCSGASVVSVTALRDGLATNAPQA